jgi:hypothetical protein
MDCCVEKPDNALNIQERGNRSHDVSVRYSFAANIKSRGVNKRYATAIPFKVTKAIDLGCHRANAFVVRD